MFYFCKRKVKAYYETFMCVKERYILGKLLVILIDRQFLQAYNFVELRFIGDT